MVMEKNSSDKNFLLKAERFCAYQERCKFEVDMKLRKLGAKPNEIPKIIQSLEEEGYLNEERFATLFAGGKFRIKRWGKNKIRAELRAKKIPEAIVLNALDGINEEHYKKTIEQLIQKKKRETRSQKAEVATDKIVRYLLAKGFESSLVFEILNKKQ